MYILVSYSNHLGLSVSKLPLQFFHVFLTKEKREGDDEKI